MGGAVMNEELDDAAVTAAVAGYPRTGRDLADGYLLAALTIRASYDANDPEIERAIRLYGGDTRRMDRLVQGLNDVRRAMSIETMRRVQRESSAELADAAATVLLPRVPGEVTQLACANLAHRHPLATGEQCLTSGPAGVTATVTLPRVPGEVTQEIRLPIEPESHRYTSSTLGWSEACEFLFDRPKGAPVERCGRPASHPLHTY